MWPCSHRILTSSEGRWAPSPKNWFNQKLELSSHSSTVCHEVPMNNCWVGIWKDTVLYLFLWIKCCFWWTWHNFPCMGHRWCPNIAFLVPTSDSNHLGGCREESRKDKKEEGEEKELVKGRRKSCPVLKPRLIKSESLGVGPRHQ